METEKSEETKEIKGFNADKNRILNERSEIAVAINFGFWPVLGIDLDIPQEYDDFRTYGMCNLLHQSRSGKAPFYVKGQLVSENGEFAIDGFGATLTNDFSASDVYEMIRESSWPKIKPGEIVVLATCSRRLNIKFVMFKRVSRRTDIHCFTMAHLEDLTDEEMQDVVRKIHGVLKAI